MAVLAEKRKERITQQDLTIEGLTPAQADKVDFLLRKGLVDLYKSSDENMPYTISDEPFIVGIEGLGQFFSSEEAKERYGLGVSYYDVFNSDKHVLREIGDRKRRIEDRNWVYPWSPKKVYVFIDTQSGEIEKIKEAGYEVETALTITQVADYAARKVQEAQAKIKAK